LRTATRALTKIYFALIVVSFILLLPNCSQLKKASPKIKQSPTIKTKPLYQQIKVRNFIKKMVEQHNFDRKQLIRLFKQVKIKQEVLNKIKHPYEEVPWYEYQQHFLTKERIKEGVIFWHKYATTLKYAEEKYKVPPNIIVAIIGVESKYGKKTGKFKVINALSTISFKYPKRSEYFQKELTQFLLLCHEKNINPLKIYGSYAGAIGQPQFMPSSFRQYAVNFNNSGHIDLSHNTKDVIGSIANFFQFHGWQYGDKIALKANLKNMFPKKHFLKRSMEPHTLAQSTKHYLEPNTTAPLGKSTYIIKLQGKNGPLYWLGFHNIFVITNYNTSIQYAMVVYQLSQEIKKAYLLSLKPGKHQCINSNLLQYQLYY